MGSTARRSTRLGREKVYFNLILNLVGRGGRISPAPIFAMGTLHQSSRSDPSTRGNSEKFVLPKKEELFSAISQGKMVPFSNFESERRSWPN